MAESHLKIGELAARAGVGVQTIHYYERLGLLPKPNRTPSNYRLYASAALRRVQFIKRAQGLGFHLQEVDARIAALRAFRRSLAEVLPKWEKETSRQRQCAGEFCDLVERLPQSQTSANRYPKKVKNKLLTL